MHRAGFLRDVRGTQTQRRLSSTKEPLALTPSCIKENIINKCALILPCSQTVSSIRQPYGLVSEVGLGTRLKTIGGDRSVDSIAFVDSTARYITPVSNGPATSSVQYFTAMGFYFGDTVLGVAFVYLPLDVTSEDFLETSPRFCLGLPYLELDLSELNAYGFHDTIPSMLSSMEKRVLQELFLVADRALVDRHGPGQMIAINFSGTLRECSSTLEPVGPAQVLPSWLPVSPRGRFVRPNLTMFSMEVKKTFEEEYGYSLS